MSHNTWIHRLVRPAVRPLAHSRLTPNHVTTLRLIAGAAAAAAYARGDADGYLWGGVLFIVSVLLDRADGELARLGGKATRWGHTYDLCVDSFCNAIVFVGLGWGLRAGPFGPWAVALGVLAGVAIAAILFMTLKMEALAGPRAGELKGAAGFDPDDAVVVVPLAVWLGWPQELLIAAAIGAPAFALFVLIVLRQRRRRLRA